MLKITRKPKPIFVIICFHTYLWTPECLRGLKTHFPEIPILFVDNNPSEDDSPERKASYSRVDSYGNASKWDNACKLESEFIKTIPNSQIIQTPHNYYHGQAMNLAMNWCRNNGYTVMVHTEPDTIISGRVWYENMIGAISEGHWMSGGIHGKHKEIMMCPTAWDVHAFFRNNLDFLVTDKTPEDLKNLADPKFAHIYDWNAAEGWSRIGWDTGLRSWYVCALQNKAKSVPLPDFTHLWGGSRKR